MANNSQLQYVNFSLPELIKVIHTGYYDTLSRLCGAAKFYIENVNKASLSWDDVAYIKISEEIINSVANYLNQRRQAFIPYIQELVQKDTAGHNCSTCLGRCSLQHNTRLTEFKMQLSELKDKIDPLIKASLQIYNTANHEDLITLNDEMDLIACIVQELLLIEKNFLVPKISEAQKNINAI